MAKTKDTTEEKVPKVILSLEEVEAIDQLRADEELHLEKAEERHEETLRNNQQVEDIQKSVQEAKKLEEGSPEWFARRRQRRVSDDNE